MDERLVAEPHLSGKLAVAGMAKECATEDSGWNRRLAVGCWNELVAEETDDLKPW